MTEETLTAHDIAADPDLYNSIVRFGNSKIEWECMGYTGKLIRFSRLEPVENMKIRVLNIYKRPDAKVSIVELYRKE